MFLTNEAAVQTLDREGYDCMLSDAIQSAGYARLGDKVYGNCRNYRTFDDRGDLYVFGDEYGPTLVIRAESFSSAWEIAIDESRSIELDEVPEAYGFWIHGDNKLWWAKDEESDRIYGPYSSKESAHDAVYTIMESQERDLAEGYEYQPNGTGTGIVNVGHYVWLSELDKYNEGVQQPIVPIFTLR